MGRIKTYLILACTGGLLTGCFPGLFTTVGFEREKASRELRALLGPSQTNNPLATAKPEPTPTPTPTPVPTPTPTPVNPAQLFSDIFQPPPDPTAPTLKEEIDLEKLFPSSAVPSLPPGGNGIGAAAGACQDAGPRTRLQGKVLATDQSVLDGALVVARSLEACAGFEIEAKAAQGVYLIPDIPANIRVQLTVTHPGYATLTDVVIVSSNADFNHRDLTLKPAVALPEPTPSP